MISRRSILRALGLGMAAAPVAASAALSAVPSAPPASMGGAAIGRMSVGNLSAISATLGHDIPGRIVCGGLDIDFTRGVMTISDPQPFTRLDRDYLDVASHDYDDDRPLYGDDWSE